jgi:2-keto-4-pentenoate hydratase/2-oxohepta-3-ene-1,7-dioic acid hydratase in catechol pathway
MRLARFRHGSTTALGVVDGETVVDASAIDPALPGDMVALLEAGPAALERLRQGLAAAPPEWRHPLDEVELLAPVARPPKFLAIGLNYADHIAETGRDAPQFPVFFNKQSTCVVGPGQAVHVPRVSTMVDYEGELGMVIGRRCRHVPVERALEVVAGYTVVNDVTVRDWQLRSPTMTIGKSFDTHGPIGPWIVTPDEVGDPQALSVRTWVNGELLQDGSTAEMIHSCAEQIATLSTAFTLEPGDVIATGTPAGVGMARQPPVWLRPGDTVRVEIGGVGVLENPVVAEPASTATF